MRHGTDQPDMKKLLALMVLLPVVAAAQTATPSITAGSSNGPAIDKNQNPVIDPTANVISLVHALEKKLDDAQKIAEKGLEDKFKEVERSISKESEITTLRAFHNSEITKLRAELQATVDTQESKRLDAIRRVDQEAVKTESERSQAAITALATVAATTAEALRNAVNTTATNLATQLDRTTSAITERIASLEKAQYTGAGKAAINDPNAERLAISVDKLVSAQSQGVGKGEGISASMAMLISGALVFIALIGLMISGLAIFMQSRKNGDSLEQRGPRR